MAGTQGVRQRKRSTNVEIEEIPEKQESQQPPKHSPSPSEVLNSALGGFKLVLSDMKGMLSPHASDMRGADSGIHVPTPSVNHPGIDNVDMATAMEQCPHLKDMLAKQKGKSDSSREHSPNLHETETGSEAAGSKPTKCPVDHKSESLEKNAKCPYQDPQAHEWPMRAVLIFLAFNVISSGVSSEVIKIGFVVMACYIGMLRSAEFAVLYVTTASMSSYKLLGLLLMLTNKGGPRWSPELYRVSPSAVAIGVLAGVLAIGFGMIVKQGEIAYGFYRPAPWKGPSHLPHISPLFNLVVPILNEFVYRQFLLNELGKDLGTWFGLLGSSVWFGIMLKASKAKLLANFFQGLFLGCTMLVCKKNLLVPTIAHSTYTFAFSLFPNLNQFIVL